MLLLFRAATGTAIVATLFDPEHHATKLLQNSDHRHQLFLPSTFLLYDKAPGCEAG